MQQKWRKVILYNSPHGFDREGRYELSQATQSWTYCHLCDAALDSTDRVSGPVSYRTPSKVSAYRPYRYTLVYCVSCGWWCECVNFVSIVDSHFHSCTAPTVKSFDITSLDVPRDLLVRHLAQKTEDLYSVHPRVFEDLIGKMFNEHLDCRVSLTRTSRDGGYDLYGLDSDERQMLVEVKRYKRSRKVGVRLIREFAGVLLRENVDLGVFVTSSQFTHPAITEAAKFAGEGQVHRITLELRDIESLCSWLGALRNANDPDLNRQSELYRRLREYRNQGT